MRYVDTEELKIEANAENDADEAPEDLPYLSLASFVLEVRHDLTLLWILLAVLSVCAVIFGFVFYRRLRRLSADAPASGESSGLDFTEAQRGLHVARQRRLDGDYYGFYVELGCAAGLFDSELSSGLNSRAQQIGYRNVEPTQDDLDGDLKKVESALRRKLEEYGNDDEC